MAQQENLVNRGKSKGKVRMSSKKDGKDVRVGNSKEKIQWTRSKSSKKNKKSSSGLSFIHLLIITLICSCISEWYFLFNGSIVLIFGILISVTWKIRAQPHDNIPQGEGYIPILGHLVAVIKHWNDFYDEETAQFLRLYDNKSNKRKYYSTAMPLNKNFIFVADDKIIDLLFRIKFGDSIKGEEQHQIMEPLLGNGIFAVDGELWKKQRALASRMFTMRSLKDYMFDVFMNTSNGLITKLDEMVADSDIDDIDIYNMYHRLTSEAFLKVAFGVDIGIISAAPKRVPFAKAFDSAIEIMAHRYFDPMWKLLERFNIGREKTLKQHGATINKFVYSVIDKTKQEIKANKDDKMFKKYNLLSIFMKDNPDISDKEVRDIALNFILAGRDTTAQTLSWFTYVITQKENESVANKLMSEINGISDDLNYNILINECEYLEACLLETLRLYPSVPHLVRYAVTDIKLPNGDIIRDGDGIVIPCYVMGRMPFLWDEPNKFKPERFINKTYPTSVYPAFNIPPRLCLGKHLALLEAKMTVIKLFKKYNIIPIKNQEVTYQFSMTHQMKYGFKVNLQPK